LAPRSASASPAKHAAGASLPPVPRSASASPAKRAADEALAPASRPLSASPAKRAADEALAPASRPASASSAKRASASRPSSRPSSAKANEAGDLKPAGGDFKPKLPVRRPGRCVNTALAREAQRQLDAAAAAGGPPASENSKLVAQAASAPNGHEAAALERLAVGLPNVAERVRKFLDIGTQLPQGVKTSDPPETQWKALVRKAKNRDSAHHMRQRSCAYNRDTKERGVRLAQLSLAASAKLMEQDKNDSLAHELRKEAEELQAMLAAGEKGYVLRSGNGGAEEEDEAGEEGETEEEGEEVAEEVAEDEEATEPAVTYPCTDTTGAAVQEQE